MIKGERDKKIEKELGTDVFEEVWNVLENAKNKILPQYG